MDNHDYTFDGVSPEIHDDAAVSAESTLVGDVTVEADATVWPGAVLRGDVDPVEIGEGSAIGDNAVLHGSSTAENALVGHSAVLNESHVAESAMIGFNATLSSATIGARSLVAMGTGVPDGYEVPPDTFVFGTPAQVKPLEETDVDRDEIYEHYAAGEYGHLVQGYEDLFDS